MPPYNFAKGPIVVFFEDYTRTKTRAKKLLKELSTNVPTDELGVMKKFKAADRVNFDHFVAEAIGPGDPAKTANMSQRQLANATEQGRQRELMMREGLTAALAVALGVEPNLLPGVLDTATLRDPPWPIDLYWRCGDATKELWVNWRENPGIVTMSMTLNIPASANPPDLTRLAGQSAITSKAKVGMYRCTVDRAGARWERPGAELGIGR